MTETQTATYKIWHDFVKAPSAEKLAAVLDDDVRFHSPFVWKPKEGAASATAILLAVTEVFQNFRYVREITRNDFWALEFEARVGELSLRGIDLITINDAGKIIDFEVMIRPANALQLVGAEMSSRLFPKSSN